MSVLENDDNIDYYVPEWKKTISFLESEKGLKDAPYLDRRDYLIKEREVALKHPEQESIVKIRDDGSVDIFAGETLGMRFDPGTKSCTIFADDINMVSKNVNLFTDAKGFRWNRNEMNAALYHESETEKEGRLQGTKQYYVHDEKKGWHWEQRPWSVRPFNKPKGRTSYSPGMLEMMKKLNLPID